MKYYPQNKDCFICNGYGCPRDEMDELGYLDCMLYIKQRDGKGKTSVEIWNKEKKEWVKSIRLFLY